MLQAKTRKLIGCLALMVYLTAYVVAIVHFGARVINDQGPMIQLIYYVTAGVAWVLPLKPLMRWMR